MNRAPARILHTVPAAAAALSISERTMWRLIDGGQIAAVRIRRTPRSRALCRVEQAEIDRFIAANRQPATT